MPMDIRKYLNKSPKEPGKTKKPLIVTIQSSDEDDTKANTSSKHPKLFKKSTRRLSDSDDDVSAPRKVTDKKPAKEAKTKEKLKSASPHDIFGTKPIKRVAATTVSKKLLTKESEFHDDANLEATLCQLDESQFEIDNFQTVLHDANSNGKRSFDESDKGHETKKSRRDGVWINDEKSDKINHPGNASQGKASSSNKGEVSRKIGTNDEKADSVKTQNTNHNDGAKSTKDLATSEKLKFGNSKARKKKTEIVFEKNETKKKNKDTGDCDDVYELHNEKKKERVVLYNKYLQRGGARNPGSKPIPKGAENCLAGLTFLVTGVLESLERDEADDLIQQYGGRIVKSLSKKTDYMVVGDEAGVKKLENARTLGTKQISEDELLAMIESKPAGKSSDIIQGRTKSKSRKRSRSPEKTERSEAVKKICISAQVKSPSKAEEEASSSMRQHSQGENSTSVSDDISRTKTDLTSDEMDHIALVEKYRPKTMNKIIGQHGDKSNAKKLHTWLSNWQKNQSGTVKLTKPSPYAQNDDGSFFKACLLSGPPGIGKTTTAQVVCAELKLDLLEFNASDTRSKRLLKEEVSGILSNTTIKGYFTQLHHGKPSSKHVLLMDEVDGMAGNEDRGGLQELISLIKSSEVPIICICNDRAHPKMRTLGNYTYSLRFQKPRIEAIRGAMKSMCYKENINVSTEDIDRLIQSTNQDIRQVINQLAILGRGSTNHESAKTNETKKDLRLGPWDVIRKVFSATDHKDMSIHDKSDLFFHDYNIAGLFVQENYLSVTPNAPSNETLDRIARAADSLSMSDLIENSIRGNGAWSLLPTQACFSSVIPGSLMSGRLNAQVNFPSWLGRNSIRGKFDRLLQEVTVHARLTTGASKEAINIDYLKHLRDAILRPLALHQNDGIDEAMNVMNTYHLLREDVQSLVEVSLWPGQRDPFQVIDSKVKAAFTRAYNKSSAPVPYLINAAPKKKSNQASQDEGFMDGDDEDVDSDGDNDDMNSDRMIKPKNATASNKTDVKPTKRGRGRGKAK